MRDILDYIDSNIPPSDLKNVLVELVDSKDPLSIQCAINILIDKKYSLVEDYYEALASATKKADAFVKSMQKQFHLNCCKPDYRYVMIVASNIYRNYFRPGANSTLRRRFDNPKPFNEQRIIEKGWLGYKDQRYTPVAWITPYPELQTALQKYETSGAPSKSNFIHDYIGVPTNKNYKQYLSPFDNDATQACLIIYSDQINVDLYHPNCTIAYGWDYKESNNLFVSFGNPMDQYGRTFNELDSGFARERVHKNFHHFDQRYQLVLIEDDLIFNSDTIYDRTKLIKEAEARLL